MKKFPLEAVIILLISVFLFSCQKSPSAQFQSIEQKYNLDLGVAGQNLTTGKSIFYHADSLFATASVIKVPILIELYRQYQTGSLNPRHEVYLDSTNVWGGSGILQLLTLPQTLRLQDAAELMIIVSDNTATNLVFDQLGPNHDARLDSVNTTLRNLGIEHTEILNKPMSWETKKDTPKSWRYGIGVSSPRDLMKIMTLLHDKSIISPTASEAMIGIMRDQFYNELVPKDLPVFDDTLSFAHKTGGVSTAKCDIGLIFSPSDTIAFAVMTDNIPDSTARASHNGSLAVSEAAKIMYKQIK